MKTIILGAGVTGLAAGYKTGGVIYEAMDQPGGICRSYYKNWVRFEIGGGHWIFGDHQAVSFINRFSEVKKYTRQAGVYINDIFDYPIQGDDIDGGDPGTMKAWLTSRFGKGLCKVFFHPFNEKYTNGLYNQIIQDDPLKSPDRKSKGYNETFYYPVAGLNDFVDCLAAECDIKYGKRATHIFPKEKTVMFSDGTCDSYDKLISTIPLNELCVMAGIIGAKELPFTAVTVLNISAEKGESCPYNHWLYIPSKKYKFFRVGFYSNVEESFSRPGYVSIYVESAVPLDRAEVISQLQDLGFIGEIDVVDKNYIPCAYTWKTSVSQEKPFLNKLAENGIISIGRYGRWKFQGIAESIIDGLSIT